MVSITGGGNTSISSSVDRSDSPASRNRRPSSKPSSSNSEPTIKPMTEEERKANTLISSSVDHANGVDRTKEQLKRNFNEKARAEFEASGGNIPAMPNQSLNPQTMPDAKTMYPGGDYRNHIDPENSLVGTVKQKINDANEKVSSHIPSFNDVIAKRDQLEKSNEEFGNKMELIRETAHKNENVGNAVDKFATFGKGIYEEIDENPVGIGITTASMFVGGAALKVGSTAGRMGLLRAASMAGSGSKIGKGLTLTSKAIDPAIGISGVALTCYGLKDKNAEQLGHLTPHLIGGIVGGVKGWNAGNRLTLKMEMNRGFNARYENPSTTISQVDGAKNAIRPLNSDIYPLETNTKLSGNPRTNELRITESVRRGGQTIDPNAKFADNINDGGFFKPKENTIKSEITMLENGAAKPNKFQFEIEAPMRESITIQKGKVKSQIELEIPRPETTLNRVTAKRRNLNQNSITQKRSIWQDETAQLLSKSEVQPTSQLNRPLYKSGYSSEIIPERTMMFKTKIKTPSQNVVPLFFTGKTNQPVFDNDFVQDKRSLKDAIQDTIQKKDTSIHTKNSINTPNRSTLYTPYNEPKPNNKAVGVPLMLEMTVPMVDIPIRQKSKKKTSSSKEQKDSWKYKRTTNKYKSPLDVKIKGLI